MSLMPTEYYAEIVEENIIGTPLMQIILMRYQIFVLIAILIVFYSIVSHIVIALLTL